MQAVLHGFSIKEKLRTPGSEVYGRMVHSGTIILKCHVLADKLQTGESMWSRSP